MHENGRVIGRVTRCNTRSFIGASRLPEPDLPAFGAFCKVPAQQGQTDIIGLIYDIAVEDDELTRQLAIADPLPGEILADGRANRLVPIEVHCLAVGYRSQSGFHHNLPPQPPLTLSEIAHLEAEEVRLFSEDLRFISLILASQDIAVEALLVAALQNAAGARPAEHRELFLLEAGRRCARLLARDLPRLENVIQGLRP